MTGKLCCEKSTKLILKMFCSMRFLMTLVLFFFFAKFDAMRYDQQDDVSVTITVSKNGGGKFSTVQQAIDSIPSNNEGWIRIQIQHGVYHEKVTIPQDKPFVILEGDPNHQTTIEFGASGSVVESPTFKAFADNFVAKNIVFKNTYDHLISFDPNNGRKTTWAPAAKIAGDKASFYNCTFISLQDTLTDFQGRHYFYGCNIQGAIDFIWGNGQSIYEKCRIMALSKIIGTTGYITAQGREGPNETTGFVFKDCHVCGSGRILLGRAYRTYARVLFSGTYMENIVAPEGWSEWEVRPVDTITFSEAKCRGPGANMSHRISWEKKLSDDEVGYLTNTSSFINQDGWLEKQPH